MIELQNISAGYDRGRNRKRVLFDVSLKIKAGKISVVMGPNGAGKSTLLKVMFGLLKPGEGRIMLDGMPVSPSPQLLVRKGIFMIPQGKRVFPHMTVLENIELAAHAWPDRGPFPERLDEALRHFPDLKSRRKDLAGNLSGGQQQMVALARGLINSPKMIFLDEPSIGLSPKLISDIFRRIKEINGTLGTAFVIVEHNLKSLLPLADHAYVFNHGRMVYSGGAETKTLDKMLEKIFEKGAA